MNNLSEALILTVALLVFGSGCMSISVDSAVPKSGHATTARPYKFRIAAIDADGPSSGGVGNLMGGTDGEGQVEAMNKALSEIRPDLYDGEDGIPVAIRLSSFSSGGGGMVNPFLVMLFYDWHESTSKVTVKIYEKDGVTGHRGTSEVKTTIRMGLFPFALIPGNRKDRQTRRSIGNSGFRHAFESVMTESLPKIYADALANALDSLPDEKIEALSHSVPLTRTDATRRRILEARSIETVHLSGQNESGVAPRIVEHRYNVTDKTVKPSHPTVVEQDYSAMTLLGHVKVETTGFLDEEADEWILHRLIPRICETKALVVTFDELPVSDAMYRVLEDKTDENNVRTVKFQQIQ